MSQENTHGNPDSLHNVNISGALRAQVITDALEAAS